MISENKCFYNIKNIIDKRPITADLFITNFCNNKCVYCTYNRWELQNKKKYVGFEEFKRNIEILKSIGVKGFILTGGGEPMINPDFDLITRYLENEKLDYGINTNFNVIKKCNPVYLKVSLDVHNAEEYRKIRGVDAFDIVINNIKEYSKIKNNTNLLVQCVVTKKTKVEEFYNNVKDLDVDYIVFRPIESTMACDYEFQNTDAIETIKEIKKDDDRILLNYKWFDLKTKFDKCYAENLQIAVDENSDVIYCCHKPYEKICHITDKNLLKKKSEFKTDMCKCDIPCRLTGPNKLLKDFVVPKDVNFI